MRLPGDLGSGIRPSNAVLLPACLLVCAACLLFYRSAGRRAYPLLVAGLCGIPASALAGRRATPTATPGALAPLVAASGLADGDVVVVQHSRDHCRAVLDQLFNLSAGDRLDHVVIAELPPFASPNEAKLLFPPASEGSTARMKSPCHVSPPSFRSSTRGPATFAACPRPRT